MVQDGDESLPRVNSGGKVRWLNFGQNHDQQRFYDDTDPQNRHASYQIGITVAFKSSECRIQITDLTCAPENI